MTTVHVVLHAEATHHVDDLVGGWFDSELTARGLDQSRKAAEVLRSRVHSPARVLSSDLRRALQTAAVIAEVLSVKVEPVFDLREMGCGVAEGKSRAWLDARLVPPPLHGNRLDHQICEGAETRRQAALRVQSFVGTLLREVSSSAIVVTHGVIFTYLLSAWIGMPVDAVSHARFSASAGSITTLEVDPIWGDRKVVSLNETAHLHA